MNLALCVFFKNLVLNSRTQVYGTCFLLLFFNSFVLIVMLSRCSITYNALCPTKAPISFSFSLYRISKNIPTTKDVEPLLEIDGDIRSFEVFLSSRTPVLTARDVDMFLPCTVNLDPKLREIIAGSYTLSICTDGRTN